VTSLEVGVERDFEDMFHAGDEGVYKAKENGRNQVVYVGLD
jgi:PleD family two-component response regulator